MFIELSEKDGVWTLSLGLAVGGTLRRDYPYSHIQLIEAFCAAEFDFVWTPPGGRAGRLWTCYTFPGLSEARMYELLQFLHELIP